MKKTWFITGASRGFGRVWTEAALTRGDQVAATARNVASIADLTERFGNAVLPLDLDVTDPEQVRQAVARAHAHFGRLDVVMNNAGYSLVGTIEEGNEADVRAEFDTNYFGTLRVIQAALPLLRQQGSGHILGISSTLGHVAMPLIGSYCASKWAFEAMHESLAQEVKPFGIKVTLVEPGAYATSFGSPESLKMAPGMDIYAGLRQQIFAHLRSQERGDPQATSEAVFKIVDAEEPPLRLILGNMGLPMVRAAYAARLATWEAWEAVSNSAQGEAKKSPVALSTQTLDLTKTAPASPKHRVGGYVILARMADKARAEFLGGNIGEYHTDCPLDHMLLDWKGVPFSDIKAAVVAGADNAAIAEHLDSHGTPKTPEEVKAWSDGAEEATLAGLYEKYPERKDYLAQQCQQLGLELTTTTMFEWLDADDKAIHKA